MAGSRAKVRWLVETGVPQPNRRPAGGTSPSGDCGIAVWQKAAPVKQKEDVGATAWPAAFSSGVGGMRRRGKGDPESVDPAPTDAWCETTTPDEAELTPR